DDQAEHQCGPWDLQQMKPRERPAHQPANQDHADKNRNPGQAPQVTKRETDERGGERAETFNADDVPINANHEARDRKQQQESNEMLLRGWQIVKRNSPEDAMQRRLSAFRSHRVRNPRHRESVVQSAHISAANQAVIVVAEYQITPRQVAEMLI